MVHQDESVKARQNAQDQWNNNPCGAVQSAAAAESLEYFEEVKKNRYRLQPWMLSSIWGDQDFKDKALLEIGVGHGTDMAEFAKRGALCHGIDITDRHLHLCKRNLDLRGYPVVLKKCDATEIAFPDQSFDVVYSFGVLHHIPEIEACFSEIRRVLKPGGKFIFAVYHKNSAFFWFSKFLRHGLLRGGLLRLGYKGLLATIEQGADGVKIRPYVRLYKKKELSNLIQKYFRLNELTAEHLFLTDIISAMGGLVPLISLDFAKGALGWYLVAKASKIS
jgi:ubiquinone/menaquinone biosynthesis C-methylase UbiE